MSAADGGYLFDAVDPDKHPTLARRTSNDHNRRLAVRHLKSSLCSGYIKDLYEDFTSYMQQILEAAARNGISPGRLIGQQKISIEANDLLSAGTWENSVHLVAQLIFRRLEDERNTRNLIQAMDSKLGLGLEPAFLTAALPYFELRHLLVHHDGVADADFCQRFPDFGATAGKKISVEFVMVRAARNAIVDLAKHFDAKVVQLGLVKAQELQ